MSDRLRTKDTGANFIPGRMYWSEYIGTCDRCGGDIGAGGLIPVRFVGYYDESGLMIALFEPMFYMICKGCKGMVDFIRIHNPVAILEDAIA